MADTTASRVFRRTCQVAAIAGSNRLEEVLDWLVPVMVYYYSDRRWSNADDWYEAIQESFNIELALHDISECLVRLVGNGHLIRDSYRDEYRLSKSATEDTERRLLDADSIEQQVSKRWLASVSAAIPEGGDPWAMLLRYAATIFRSHGSDAVSLLRDDADTHKDTGSNRISVLENVLDEFGIAEPDRLTYAAAIGRFFSAGDPETVAYITQLADSTFNLMALSVDEEIRIELKSRLPKLRIFLDTNILFSLLGTHDTPLAAASVDLFRVIDKNNLPFKLYCHAKTVRELENSIESASSRLTGHAWPKAVSSALIKLPWQATRISGIEMRFHQLNAAQPISPTAFCARYSSPLALLGEFGIEVFREPDALDNSERMTLRATITEDYKEFLRSNPRRRKSRYETYEHDAILWMIAKENQLPTRKGTLYSGSFVLSSDYFFWRFDKSVLRKEYGTRPVVVLPDALLQALRPFVGASHQFDDAAFARLFATAELRGTNGKNYSDTVQRVSSYLASFSDLQEETALHILTDSILMQRISKHEESTPEFREAIERAVFAHNEELVRQRDELLDERRDQLELARKALAVTDGTDDSELIPLLSSLVQGLQQQFTYPEVTIIEGGQHVTNIHGGYYENNESQVIAQGPGAQATGNTVSQHQVSIDTTDPELAAELGRLKVALVQIATTSSDFDAVSGVQGAIEAIESGKDESSIMTNLKKAGGRALEIAVELGTKVAAKAIESSLGI